MLDTLITFLWANLTPYGTFEAYWMKKRDTLNDNNVFISLLFLDAVRPHLRSHPSLKPLTDSVLKSPLKYRPPKDMWRYWIDRPIPPDFDDIALAGMVLPSYNLDFDGSVIDTIKSYTDTTRMCVVLFKDELSKRKKRCDCVVNVNVLRFTKDTTLCDFIRKCVESPHSYTYLQPKGFMLYFLAKAYGKGVSCGIDVKREVKNFISQDLKGMDMVLGFAAATNLGLKGGMVDTLFKRLKGSMVEGGLPPYAYFRTIKGDFIFWGRTLPTVIFLDGVLKY